MNIKFRGKQKELFRLMQTGLNCCFVVSIRSGKTLMCFLRAVELAQQPNKNIVYLAPTHQMLKNIFVKEFLPELRPAEAAGLCTITNDSVDFVNGSRIFFLSADRPERLRGLTIDLAIADEVATMKSEVIAELLNRTAKTPGREQGQVILISTPNGKNPFYHFIYGDDENRGIIDNAFWHYRKYDAFQMKVIDEDTINQLKETKDEVSFNQDVLCDFTETRGKIFTKFDEKLHLKPCSYDRSKPLYIGMDFNYDPMTAILSQKRSDGGINIVDEVYLRYSDTEELCNEINNRYGNPAVIIFPDASGGQHTAATGKSRTNFKIIKRIMGEGSMRVASKNPPVLDTINEVNEAFKNGLVNVSPKCKHLLLSLHNYKWKEGVTNVPDKDNINDHMADCLRYLIHNLYPMRKEVPADAPQYWNQMFRA
jgi:phage terminase large subunit